MITISMIFIGGGIGAVLRYVLGGIITLHSGGSFPWGTLLVNCIGGLLIGMAATYFSQQLHLALWRNFTIAGVLGGFTTFSAFGLETVQLYEKGAYLNAGCYVIASVVGVICLVMVGGALMRSIL